MSIPNSNSFHSGGLFLVLWTCPAFFSVPLHPDSLFLFAFTFEGQLRIAEDSSEFVVVASDISCSVEERSWWPYAPWRKCIASIYWWSLNGLPLRGSLQNRLSSSLVQRPNKVTEQRLPICTFVSLGLLTCEHFGKSTPSPFSRQSETAVCGASSTHKRKKCVLS